MTFKTIILVISFIFCTCLTLMPTTMYAQEIKQEATEEVSWISFDSVQVLSAIERRPILIDLYTDWCGWCKVMDKTTYKDPRVATYLNKYFYTVRFDAESKEDVNFFGKKFVYGTYGKAHDLAVYLTNGNLAFPTTIVLPSNDMRAGVFPGYLKTSDIEKLMKFFATGANLTKDFQNFSDSFVSDWK